MDARSWRGENPSARTSTQKKWARFDDLLGLGHPEEEDFSYRVGTIAGQPAIISISSYLTTFAFEPRDFAFFEKLVVERGCTTLTALSDSR
jgi:hypothetical protein